MVNSGGGKAETEAAELPEGVTILTGPAGAGKTTAALELYRRSIGEDGAAHCLLIVPNGLTVRHVRRLLLEESPSGVLIAPAVTTFSALAGGILARAGRPAQMLNPAQRHLLLGRVISQLKQAGRLKTIAPLADTPGLITALDLAIAELKRAAIEPEALAGAMGKPDAKDADLLAVYRLYQERLRSEERVDVEGRLWLARDVLVADPTADLGYADPSAIAVDGFTDFTPTQLKLLALLSPRVKRLLLTLPLADQPGRKRLWFWTGRTLERLVEAMPQARVLALPDRGDPLETLFELTGGAGGEKETPNARARAGAFSIATLEAPDVEAEVRAVARMVKRDLAGQAPATPLGPSGGSPDPPPVDGGAGAAGQETGRAEEHGQDAPAARIAVIARGLEAYAEPLERIFAECDIPIAPRARPLAECGIVGYLLRLLGLGPEFEFHDLLTVLKSSYFRPGALGAGFDQTTVATAEMAIRAGNVLRGRKAYAQAFARLRRRLEARQAVRAAGAESDEGEAVEPGPLLGDASGLEGAASLLEALLSRLDELSAAHAAAAYAQAVRDLVADLELVQSACAGDEDEQVAADLRALSAFDQVLSDLAQAGLPVERPGGLCEWVRRACAVSSCPAARGEALAEVMDVLDARALRFDRVYLLGVSEKAFPQLSQERCFIAESDRAAWAQVGLPLDRRRDLLGREMLLFYLAATRGGALTVSYVEGDGAGSGPGGSVFVQELVAAAQRQGIAVSRRRISPGQFVPPADELASPEEAFDAAVASAFDPDCSSAPALLGWARRNKPDVLARASFGLLASHRRWRRAQPDAFDGRLDDSELLAWLGQTIPARWVFSATELNAYAACPWQFFARYLLGLSPLLEPRRQMTPADRGLFCHAVLWQLFADLAGSDAKPVCLAAVEADRLESALAQAVETQRRRLADQAAYQQLWDVQTRYWQSLLWSYLRRQRTDAPEVGSLYFELAFGRGGDRGAGTLPVRPTGETPMPGAGRTPASRPVEIDAAGMRIRLAGKIDRVDAAADEALLAVDYKTGAMPSVRDLIDGRDLQLALYAKVLEAVFGRCCAGGQYHGIRTLKVVSFTKSDPPKVAGVRPQSYDQLLGHALAAARQYIEAMVGGRFDALPADGCPSHCAFRRICHHSPARAERKLPRPAAQDAEEQA